jgi:hypothetical protein
MANRQKISRRRCEAQNEAPIIIFFPNTSTNLAARANKRELKGDGQCTSAAKGTYPEHQMGNPPNRVRYEVSYFSVPSMLVHNKYLGT